MVCLNIPQPVQSCNLTCNATVNHVWYSSRSQHEGCCILHYIDTFEIIHPCVIFYSGLAYMMTLPVDLCTSITPSYPLLLQQLLGQKSHLWSSFHLMVKLKAKLKLCSHLLSSIYQSGAVTTFSKKEIIIKKITGLWSLAEGFQP